MRISCLSYLDFVDGWIMMAHDMMDFWAGAILLWAFYSPLQRLSSDSAMGSLPTNSLLLDCVVLLLVCKCLDTSFYSQLFSNYF